MADEGTTLGVSTSPLCRKCQTLDFEQIVNFVDIPVTGLEVADLGKTSRSKLKTACSLCRFFQKVEPAYIKNYTMHLRLFTRINSLKTWMRSSSSLLPQQPFFGVLRRHAKLSYDFRVEDEIRTAGIVCYVPYEDSTTISISPVDATTINWQAIMDQIDHCGKQHPLCQQKQLEDLRLPYIFLIDCSTGDIVKGSLSDRYMALSYVWGQHYQNFDLDFKNSIAIHDAPLTVQDAITAVLKLGRRLLWIDRYCINQQNESEQQMMIENMDLIYEAAEATLVALYGEHDASGLPGVSSVPRRAQPVFDTGRGRLIHSFSDVTTLIETSKWNSRGWTYQEARLSQRCLFFSDAQVYIVCRQSTWSEAIPFDPSTTWISQFFNSRGLASGLFGLEGDGGEDGDRLEFSKRSLSRESDALNAFRGFLRRSSFITLWGVRVVPLASNIDPNVGLALGLLWSRRLRAFPSSVQSKTSFHSSRRLGFPTWAWASLHADISQDFYGIQSMYGQYLSGEHVSFPANEANVLFSSVVDGEIVPLRDAVATRTSPVLPEHSPELHCEGYFVSIRRNGRGQYYLFDRWLHFEADISDDTSDSDSLSTEKNAETEVDALVLIQWKDEQRRKHTKRFVVMVVNWIDQIHAERVGLLTHYRDEFQERLIDSLPRVRKRFILQ